MRECIFELLRPVRSLEILDPQSIRPVIDFGFQLVQINHFLLSYQSQNMRCFVP